MSNHPPRISPIACSPMEFCHAVGIGKTRFYAQVKAGKIKILKDGRKTLVLITELEAYLRGLSEPRVDQEIPAAAKDL